MESRSILVCTLCGAVGFGVGGAIGGSLWSFSPDNPMFPLTMSIMGAIGYTSQGLASRRNWKKTTLLALVGAVVFTAGSWPVLFTTAVIITELPVHPYQIIWAVPGLLVFGGFQGVAGSVPLLLVLGKWKKSGRLIASGAVGFAIGAQAVFGIVLGLPGSLVLAIWGAVGGATLGAALGYLKKNDLKKSG